jgi:hypothetical protein
LAYWGLPIEIDGKREGDPDQHDGSVERMIVVGLCLLSLAIFSLAAVQWRRAAPTGAP